MYDRKTMLTSKLVKRAIQAQIQNINELRYIPELTKLEPETRHKILKALDSANIELEEKLRG